MNRKEKAFHIDVEYPVEMFFRDIFQESRFRNPGNSEKDVDLTIFLGHFIKEPVEVAQSGDISLDATRPRTDSPVELVLSTSHQINPRAFLRESCSRCQTDAG